MAITSQELKLKLKNLAETLPMPYTFADQGDKVILDQKLVDAKWIKLIGAAGLKDTLRHHLYIDERKHTVYWEQERGRISWSGGIPSSHFNFSWNRGQTFGFTTHKAYGMKTDGTIGKIYDFTVVFSMPPEIKKLIEDSGWQMKRKWRKGPAIVAGIPIVIFLYAIIHWVIRTLISLF